jgi:TldD protein
MSISRRRFIQHCSAAAALGVVAPRLLRADRANSVVDPAFADPNVIRAIAMRAIDAARQAGAAYADVRLTRTIDESFVGGVFGGDNEALAIGVRALVNGYWGFAASPFWNADDAVRLARSAVQQASANARGTPRTVELGTVPAATGTWVMPVRQDPFTLSLEEKIDFIRSWTDFANHYRRGLSSTAQMAFYRQERTVTNTEGAYFSQTVYQTSASFYLYVDNGDWRASRRVTVPARGLTTAGQGWELLLDAKLRDQIPQLIDEGEALMRTPVKPVEIGRRDVVFDAPSAAMVMDSSIGVATELDRALGYEANAGGTSYLGPDPLDVLGTAIASTRVSVSANRSAPGALATVKWDDEGVEPDEFALVRDGALVDFQTTREQAAWLAPYYRKTHHPVRSHGCAGAASALYITQQLSPNLVLTPGREAVSFDDLVAGVSEGIAMFGATVQMDYQARNGTARGVMREIRNGKLGAIIANGGLTYNALEFWKNVKGVAGEGNATWSAVARGKGQPWQSSMHSVSAVPMAVANVTVYDVMRRA